MDTAPITDIDKLVETLGGLTAASEFFGENTNTVGNWKARKRLPTRLYFEHEAALRERGISATKSLWGFDGASA